MDGSRDESSGSALRALRSAQEEVDTLRSGSLSVSAARGHILRVANATDRSLRRLLRDEESADLALRLKALAPDEIRIDSVLAELRRAERLPMEVAAAVHELLETRRRLEGGDEPRPEDPARAVTVFDRLESAVRAAGPVTPAAPAAASTRPTYPDLPDDFDDAELEDTPRGRRVRRHGSPPPWAFVAAALFAVLAVGSVVFLRGRGPDEMEQGIELFASGQYEEAAQHFWRYGEANPDDATPHLYLARIHRRTNRFDLAAEAIRRAEAIAPDDPAVHRELGFLLLDTGQAEVAIDRFRAAIELDRQSSEGWVGLVRAMRETGRGDAVGAVIEQAPAEVRALLSAPQPD